MNGSTHRPQPTTGKWTCAPTQQTMHGGKVLPTYGVQVVATGQWVGRAHPIGPTEEDRTEARCNARHFAASKAMAGRLENACTTLADILASMHDEDGSIQAVDLAAWFVGWSAEVRDVLPT